MAKRGDIARESVKNKIIEAFAADNNYVAFVDKKIYVQAQDGPGGETLQFAITMTMPKNPISADSSTAFNTEVGAFEVTAAPTTLDPADRKKIEELKAKLEMT